MKLKQLYFYTLLFILFSYIQSNAITYYAGTCPGPINWSGFTASTCPFWTGPNSTGTRLLSQPSVNDNLIIPAGCTVNVSGNPLTVNNAISLTVNGQLDFGNSNRLRLAPGSIVTVGSGGNFNAGNGGGNNNYIDIGTTAIWTANIGDVSGPFILNGGCILTGSSPNTYSPSGCGTALLPIELLEFTGTCIANGVQLNWITVTETNNDYFLIEKSSNGIDWDLVAKVGGNGTSNLIHNYIYSDFNKISNELFYYRMSQVDFDGRTAILKTIDVNCNTIIPDNMIFYPNPASTEINIHLDVKESDGKGIIRLINNLGQTIMETKVDLTKGINSFVYPVDFEPGTYTILFASDNVIIPNQQLIVMKY